MSDYIQGNNCLLYLAEANDSANLKLWACCRSFTLNGSTEVIEVTPIDGVNTDFLPTYNGAVISADGLYTIPEYSSPQWGSEQLWTWRIGRTLLYWKAVFEKEDGSMDTYDGTCYLTNTTFTAGVNDFSNVNIEAIVVSGATATQEKNIACLVVNLDSTDTTITFAFNDSDEGQTTYWVTLYDESDTVLEVQSFNAPFTNPITGEFTGLTANTIYKVGLSFEAFPYYYRDCSIVEISTEPEEAVLLWQGPSSFVFEETDGTVKSMPLPIQINSTPLDGFTDDGGGASYTYTGSGTTATVTITMTGQWRKNSAIPFEFRIKINGSPVVTFTFESSIQTTLASYSFTSNWPITLVTNDVLSVDVRQLTATEFYLSASTGSSSIKVSTP